ncbi:T6SS immunity protein Tli4 family protein [Serratia rubidaea]|uniref:T6SS immunity protein Tli4 family protein n=1 Tax=Serratia rubidaea TaxID=61652 RepID=UPI00234B3B4F|nr:T6SS immunity protein Tli4 family protein [Serratia rubidaea]MDC6119678.1 T6SS immunity protein Tli4 family protein [Serratia rubidaea]
MINKKTLVVVAIVAAGFAGWRWYSYLPPQIVLTAEERTNMEHILQGMTPRCVGRYLIDLPAGFTTEPGNVMAFINKSPVSYKRMYRPAFEQKIRLREAALRQEQALNPLDMPFLKQVYALPVGMEGIIFERNDSKSRPDSARILEAHLYTNGVAVEVEFKARNGLSSRYDEDRKDVPEIYGNTVPQKLAELTALLKRISGKAETDMPVGAGLCLPEVFIADGQGKQGESIEIAYESKNYPALLFAFDTDNISRPESTLLDRSDMMKRKIKESEGYTIASGRRELNGLYAEQWLAAGKTGEGEEKGLRFAVNIHEKTAGPTTPRLSVSFMQRGLEGDGRLSENEAVGAWRAITETLRMRPRAY